MLPMTVKYLEDIRARLDLDPAIEERITRELHTHLEEAIREAKEAGLPEGEAVREAISSLGRARVVARRMQEAHKRASGKETLMAALPHLLIALLFIFHAWDSLAWLLAILLPIVGVTLYGWWVGKPAWLYSWVGYSLVPLFIAGYLAVPSLGQILSFIFLKDGSLPNWGTILIIMIYFPLALWIVVSTSIRVVRRDWILASLMLFPLPILATWLALLEEAGGFFNIDLAQAHQADLSMAFTSGALAITTALFIRLRRRSLKVGALVAVTLAVSTIVLHNAESRPGLLGFLVLAILLLGFFLSPALLETKWNPRDENREGY